MQSEQQQRIMGYFIEEAKDHLNTIEQGLLSLQSTMEDSEMMNEVFRAAHSVKGGAGMLGINSIHRTAHRLEDCLKVLQESPVKVDSQLESLFLQVFDTLEALVEQLQGPFGLADETANRIMLDAEPVFEQLNTHLEQLVRKAASSAAQAAPAPKPANPYELEENVPLSAQIQPSGKNITVLPATFKRDVLVQLREMLQVFKQQDLPENREVLQEHCYSLECLGEEADLPGWSELLETSRMAIACPDNSYRLLASLVIKEIKQAQELAVAGRSVEIAPSEQLKALVPEPLASELEWAEFDVYEPDSMLTDDIDSQTEEPETAPANGNAPSDRVTSATNLLNGADTYIQENSREDLTKQDFAQDSGLTESDFFQAPFQFQNEATNEELNSANVTAKSIDLSDPEVGIAELNSLADIFEGQTPDLEQTWQQEEIIKLDDEQLASNPKQVVNGDDSSDFSDLIGDLDDFDLSTAGVSTSEELMGWFGDEITDEVALPSQESEDLLFSEDEELPSLADLHVETSPRTTDSAASSRLETSDFSDLLFEEETTNHQVTGAAAANELNNLFGDSFFEENGSLSDDLADFRLDADAMPELALGDDDLLTMPDSDALDDADIYGLGEMAWEEQAGLAETDSDFDDLLEISESDRQISGQPSSMRSSTSEDGLLFGEELEIDDEDTALGFDEFTFEEPVDNFELASSGDFDWGESEFDRASSDFEDAAVLPSREASESMDLLGDNFLDASTTDNESFTDFDLEDVLATDDLDGFESTDSLNLQESALDWESETEDALDVPALNLDVDESLWNLDESEFASAETGSAGIEALTGDFDFDTTSTQDDLFENETPSSLELPQSSNLNSLEGLGNWSNSSAAQTDELTFEEFDLDSLQESEAIQDFDTLNDFFDAEESETSDINNPTEFDDFSLLDTSTATDNADSTAEDKATAEADDLEALLGDENPQEAKALDLSSDTLNFEEDLFATGASVEGWDFETQPEAALFDEDTEASQAVDDLLDWNAVGTVEEENLDNWLGLEANEATEAQDGTLELEEDEAAALGIDWETADNDVVLEELTAASLGASALSLNSQTSEFDDLDALLASSGQAQAAETPVAMSELDGLNEFDDLEALLTQETPSTSGASTSADMEGFEDLEALLSEQMPAATEQSLAPAKSAALDADDFGDLEKLLEQADQTMGGPPTVAPDRQVRPPMRSRPSRGGVFQETMRVPVRHLDSLSNLVGELVVNRNSLEQDQERLRQFLDNLSHQVLALSDVGSRMQDLYERSLLETSLLASRQGYRTPFNSQPVPQNSHPSGVEYDPLEMDRFTGFHSLSQEMIELIVRVRESASDIEFLVDETDQVARMLRQVTTQLQEGLTRSRMVPFAQTADRLPRAVRDISQKLGKEAQLYVEGKETLIDKMILEHLNDPMTHLINNALTHGIELPEVRRKAGKPTTGRITLRAFHQGNQTVIAVADDGAGINPEQVRAKAIERKLITPAEAKTLTNLDLYNFLFHPGFTTKDKEDEYAGRGVGMDVVLTSLSDMRGTIHIDSTLGKGTTFTIRLPLTLSICKALSCLSERARIAFPMDGVEDMLDLPHDRVQTNSEGQTCIQWRDTLLPFQPLSDLLKYNRQLSRGTVYGGKREDDMISIVVLRSAGNFMAIQVDQVLGEQEIVIKQLEGPAPKPVGIAGATVLGDGRIMPIADVLELIDLAMGRIRKDNVTTLWSREDGEGQVPEETLTAKMEPMVLIVDDSITVRELLSMTFSKSGYRVEQARDGQEAWDKLRSGLPCDIVFCDIEMPRMDGLELLSRLQKDETLCKLPIAMLTSRGADRHRQMAAQLGANGYFTKPYLEEVLLEAANRMIKGEVLFGTNSNA